MTQRKFLRITSGFAEAMSTRDYPRLFTLDFMNDKEKSAQELARIEIASQMNTQQQQPEVQKGKDTIERDLEAERERDEEARREQMEAEAAASNEAEVVKDKSKPLCIRVLCENEENWHAAGSPFEITEKVIMQNSALYLSRMMLLLRQSDLELEILTSEAGETEISKLTEVNINFLFISMNSDFPYS